MAICLLQATQLTQTSLQAQSPYPPEVCADAGWRALALVENRSSPRMNTAVLPSLSNQNVRGLSSAWAIMRSVHFSQQCNNRVGANRSVTNNDSLLID